MSVNSVMVVDEVFKEEEEEEEGVEEGDSGEGGVGLETRVVRKRLFG